MGFGNSAAPGGGHGVGQEKGVEGEERRRAPGAKLQHIHLSLFRVECRAERNVDAEAKGG